MTRPDNRDKPIGTADAAALLLMSEKKLYQLVKDGVVPALKLGNRFLFSTTELLRMVADGNMGTSSDGDEVGPAPEVQS